MVEMSGHLFHHFVLEKRTKFLMASFSFSKYKVEHQILAAAEPSKINLKDLLILCMINEHMKSILDITKVNTKHPTHLEISQKGQMLSSLLCQTLWKATSMACLHTYFEKKYFSFES